MIKVVSQTTDERRQEIRELFEKIRPLLDDGYSYRQAVIKVKNISSASNVAKYAWFRDVVKYGKEHGYNR